jgi:hypothetical protein
MTPPPEPQEGDVSLLDLVWQAREFGRVIWLERRQLWLALAVTIAIGLLIAFGSEAEYSASTKLLPYRNATGAGALSSLAGLAGFRLPSGAADETITADLYPVIAKTLEFRVAVAETPLRFATDRAPVSMIRYFRGRRSLVRDVAQLRDAVVSALTRAPHPDTATVTGGNGAPLRVFDREYLRIIRDLDDRLVVSIEKKTSVITIVGVMPDRFAAADLVQTASERLMRRIIDYEGQKAAEQLRFVEEQYRERRTLYEQAQRNLAVFADRNRSLVSPVALIERERLQRENDVAFQILQQVSLQLAEARIKKNQDTPVFAVLEQPTVPNQRSSPQRSVILLLAGFVGVLAGVIRIFWARLVVARGQIGSTAKA